VVGFVGRVPRFRSVVDCVTRSVFFFLLDRFFFFSVGSIGSDSISQRWDHELRIPVARLYGCNLLRDRVLGWSTASFARGRVLGPGLRARVLEIRAARGWVDSYGIASDARWGTGDLRLLPARAVGHGVHGGARFCCFDAIFVATRGMCDFSFWGEM